MQGKRLAVIFVAGLLILVTLLSACGPTAPAPAPTTTAPAPAPTTTAPAPAPTTTAPAPAPTTTAPAGLTQVIKLSFNSQYNSVQMPGKAMQWFANDVAKRSNNMIKITVYTSGTLSEVPKIYESVVAGIADIGNHSQSTTPGQFLYSETMNLPLPFANAWVASTATNDLMVKYGVGTELKNVHLLFGTDVGPIAWCSTKKDKPLLSPADVKGLKVRASGTIGTGIVKAYGGTPIYVPPPDIYDSASKGVVDALFVPIEMMKGWNLADVTYSITMPPRKTTSGNFTIMNLAKWNSLPKAAQDILTASANAAVEASARAWWYADLGSIDFYNTKPGRTWNYPTAAEEKAWTEPIQSIQDDWVKSLNTAGLKGDEVIKYIYDHIAELNARVPNEKEVRTWIEKEMP